jgi:outer membrane receptor protein involved in Fe transport
MNSIVQKLMLGCSAAAMITAAMATARAQQVPQLSEQEVEEVTVSSSRISLGGFEAPTPVTVVGLEQLESDAYGNIQDSVRQLPMISSPPASFGVSQGAAAPGTAGANFLNLRNLGTNRTLILFDGQRVVNSNLTGGVDITTLPSSVIARVDVVTGGASAAWGSDAVAGVVNFVIDKNFRGLKGNVQVGSTTNGLSRQVSGNAVWGTGFDGDRGSIMIAGSYNYRPDTILLKEQKWYRGTYLVANPGVTAATATAANPQYVTADHVGLINTIPGGIIVSSPAGTGMGAANAPANALRYIRFLGDGTAERVNPGNVTNGVLTNGGSLNEFESYAPMQTIGYPTTTYTLFMYGKYQLTDWVRASVQLNYGYFTGKGDAQSYQQTALTIRPDNAFLPATVRDAMIAGGIPSFVMGTMNSNNFNNHTVTGDDYFKQAYDSLAPATTFNRRRVLRGVATLEGTLGENWFWNVYAQHSETRYSVKVRGVAIIANLQAAQDAVVVTAANRGTSGLPLGSIACRSTLTGTPVVVGKMTAQPGCIPINVFGEGVASPSAIRYVTDNNSNFQNMYVGMTVFEGSMEGTIPSLLDAGDIAVAFGGGYRRESGNNQATVIGELGGYAVANYTTFPSAGVSVMEGFLEVNVPLLKDTFVQSLDFNAAGRLTDYTTSGQVETWKLGFTSQVIDDVKLRAIWSVDIRAPTIQDLFAPANVNTGNCIDPKTNVTGSCINNVLGNPTLNPEVARTVSGGVVLTPTFLPGLSLSVDYFSINLTGQISAISNNVILNTCRAQWLAAGNLNDPLCTALVFDGPGGSLNIINRTPVNLSSLSTSGFDIQASYGMDLWGGALTLTGSGTYVDQITLQQTGQPDNNYAGVLGTGTAPQSTGQPKWKGQFAANYKTGPYSLTAQVRWFGSAILNNQWNTGNQATATTRWFVSDDVFNVDPTAYLDLRASYQWSDNIEFYTAVDNLLNIPPQMRPPFSNSVQSNGGPIHSSTVYDYLGREIRAGVRFKF